MSSHVRPRRTWAVVAALATVVSLGVVAAPSATAATDPDKYCTLNISTGDLTCSSADPSAGARLNRAAVESGTSYVLGRFYDSIDLDPSDGYFTITAQSQCDTSPDLDFVVGTVPAGWNDRVSSFQGFNYCSIRLWRNGGASGAYWGPSLLANVLSTMDNQASSMTFY
jgi:hypothetical protein